MVPHTASYLFTKQGAQYLYAPGTLASSKKTQTQEANLYPPIPLCAGEGEL